MNQDSLDLKGAWTTFWTTVSGDYTGSAIEKVVIILGIVLIGFSVIKYFWDKRRGNAGLRGHGAVLWSLGFGALIISPNLLVPFFLNLLQIVIDIAMNLINSAASV